MGGINGDIPRNFESDLQRKLDEIINLPSEGNGLEDYFEQFRLKKQIARYGELDAVVFSRMYGRMPEKSECLKIRYWRCGWHIPKSREEMLLLGLALEATPEELDTMLTEILLETRLVPQDIQKTFQSLSDAQKNQLSLTDRSCFDFSTRSAPMDTSFFLTALSQRYLALVPDERLRQLQINTRNTRNFLRHILFSDIMDCIWYPEPERIWYQEQHIYSRNFSSECARFFKKGEKISRITLQRLLTVMLLPTLTVDIMNECLESLGYAPLSPDIRTKSGTHTDCLFLWILEQFEQYRTDTPLADKQRQKQMLRYVDEKIVRYLSSIRMDSSPNGKQKKKQLQDLRIMKFRSFGGDIK